MQNNLKITDLNKKNIKEDFDVCIIGAGAVGIYTAIQLSKKKISVCLIEAGNNKLFYDSYSIGFGPSFSNQSYKGAISGRYYGLGGSTSRWAGLLTPFCEYDLPKNSDIHFNTWSKIININKTHQNKVLNSLVDSQLNFDSYFNNNNNQEIGNLKDCENLVLPFKKRNLSFLFKNNKKNNKYITIFTNSVVNSWCHNKNILLPTIKSLKATSINGNILEVTSKKFIICAGTLESTRILLEIKDQMPNLFLNNNNYIGKFLSDHLSIKIGQVKKEYYEKISNIYGVRFKQRWILRKKILEYERNMNLPRYFMHYTINYNIEIIRYMREFFQLLQRKKFPIISIGKLLKISELYKIIFYRFIYNKLYVNPETPINYQLDFEQIPNLNNSINLLNMTDTYDRKILNINWKVNDIDIENFYKIFNHIKTSFPYLKDNINFINYGKNKEIIFDDAYHPVGTTVMGDYKESVTDLNMKVRGIENLWTINLGNFPSAGSANPTFSLLCMAEDFCNKIE